jgi:hypothetical protein
MDGTLHFWNSETSRVSRNLFFRSIEHLEKLYKFLKIGVAWPDFLLSLLFSDFRKSVWSVPSIPVAVLHLLNLTFRALHNFRGSLLSLQLLLILCFVLMDGWSFCKGEFFSEDVTRVACQIAIFANILLHLNIFHHKGTVKCLQRYSDFTSTIISSENNLPLTITNWWHIEFFWIMKLAWEIGYREYLKVR